MRWGKHAFFQISSLTPITNSMQLWDVCSDQEAVDLIRTQTDPTTAAKQLVDHALARFSTDNLSSMVVIFNKSALINTSKDSSAAIGVEGDPTSRPGEISEADKIVGNAKRKAQEDGATTLGISGSNSGKGHDPKVPTPPLIEPFAPLAAGTGMDKVDEEEPLEELPLPVAEPPTLKMPDGVGAKK